MRNNRVIDSTSRKQLSSVFLLRGDVNRRQPDGWTTAGQAMELAHRQPLPIGLAGRTAIVLGLTLAVRFCWVWS
jgi:hypothetical protein